MAERPTPYSISVSTLIALQSDPSSPLYYEINPSAEALQCLSSFLQECVMDAVPSSTATNNATGAGTFMEATAMATSHFAGRGGWSSVQAMSLHQFFSQLKSLTGIDLCRMVFEYVEMAASSVDSLMELMESLRRAITEGVVDGTSAHGIYLRKVCLGFDQLSFETTAILWSDLQQEINSAKAAVDATNPCDGSDHSSNEFATNRGNNGSDQDTFWPLSAEQLENALRKECFHIHEVSCASQGETFEEMEFKLLKILKHNPELPAAHFLRFLNCVKHGERVGALDALHQYFDYAIIQSTKNKSQDILQFAAILLASTYNSFGDSALAQMATDEAVRVAQQSMDASCVAFALGWIFANEEGGGDLNDMQAAIGSDKAPTDAGALLKRCASRAMEGHLRSLAAGANLSLSRYHLSGGISADRCLGERRTSSRGLAEMAWNSVADATSDRPSSEAADDGAVDRPTHMADISDSKDVMETLARQKLMSAGIWDYFGQTNLSGISSFIALYCHADQMLSHDVVTAVQNISRVSLYGSSCTFMSQDFDGSVLEKYMVMLENGNSIPPTANGCIYGEALLKLTSLWKLFNLPIDGVFLLSATLILHEWAIRRSELQQAAAFGVALESYLHPRLANYSQVMIDIFSQKSLLLSRQGKWTESKDMLRDMIKIAEENDFRTQHASLLLQLSVIQLDTNPLDFTPAMSPLFECLTMTEKFEMDGLHATALSVLAQVHLRMRNPNRAIALLKASLPSLLQREHVWYTGEAFLTLAQCRLQLAKTLDDKNKKEGTDGTKNPKLIALLRSAAQDLQKSQRYFQQCQEATKLREVFYLQARVFDSIPGKQTERETASKAFIDISNHLGSVKRPASLGNGPLDCLANMTTLERMAHRELAVGH